MHAVKRVLVISHADADGHVIAEQVRRNLSAVATFQVSTLIDPARTKGHQMWTRLEEIPEIDAHELVLFVDLMFAPASFAVEADALVAFALARPQKTFIVLDHHPLPLRLLHRAPNVHPVYRPDVYDCTFGHSTHMMVIAARLEKQPTRTKAWMQPADEVLANGIKRAAAPGGALAGERLLALLRHDRWTELEALGRDDRRFHRLPRGRRPSADPVSDEMTGLIDLTTKLLRSDAKPKPRSRAHQPGRISMSYDLDAKLEASPPTPYIPTSDRRDLEAIVTLLELAAICLTTGPDATFTKKQLITEARRLGGGDIELDENDVNLVLGKPGFLKKIDGKLRMK